MGQPATRLGDSTTGHGCFPPQSTTSASADVIVNGIGACSVGDGVSTHCCGNSCHGSTVSAGSSTVYINGKPAARIGDACACGSYLSSGSNNVFIGG